MFCSKITVYKWLFLFFIGRHARLVSLLQKLRGTMNPETSLSLYGGDSHPVLTQAENVHNRVDKVSLIYHKKIYKSYMYILLSISLYNTCSLCIHCRRDRSLMLFLSFCGCMHLFNQCATWEIFVILGINKKISCFNMGTFLGGS